MMSQDWAESTWATISYRSLINPISAGYHKINWATGKDIQNYVDKTYLYCL